MVLIKAIGAAGIAFALATTIAVLGYSLSFESAVSAGILQRLEQDQ